MTGHILDLAYQFLKTDRRSDPNSKRRFRRERAESSDSVDQDYLQTVIKASKEAKIKRIPTLPIEGYTQSGQKSFEEQKVPETPLSQRYDTSSSSSGNQGVHDIHGKGK